MIGALKGSVNKFNRQLAVFVTARVGGLALKPLILLAAASSGQHDFAKDFAILISALASLFVLTGGQTHITYYKRRFGALRPSYSHVFVRYIGDSVFQFICAVPVIIALSLIWTDNVQIIAGVILLVGVEKFFDEEQRYFLFKKDYIKWSVSFSFRTIIPSLIILFSVSVLGGGAVAVYVVSSILSLIVYLSIHSRQVRMYKFLVRTKAGDVHRVCAGFLSYLRRWTKYYSINQVWSFLSVNVYLIDRFLVATYYRHSIDDYVFFASVFNAAAIAHSLLYFTPRRPRLIQEQQSLTRELLKPVNLVLPLGFVAASFAVALVLREITPAYGSVAVAMLIGMAVHFALQAIGYVVVEGAFWKIGRGRLVATDAVTIAVMFGLFLILRPPLWSLPWYAAAGVLVRLTLYLVISRRTNEAEL